MSESSASADLPLPEPATHPRRMLDRYELIAEIAKGGMGTVYLARLSGAGGFERLMALKVMHDHLAEDETFVTMLLDEARTAAHIHHPNAVGITDVVESPVGYYLVMDYVDGFPLSHVVTHPDLSERDRIRAGTRLIVDAAQGLHAAHVAKNAKGDKLGIVHRDVSPQNVLVGRDGTGRIVDFGIALAASRVASSRPGTLKGKPQYMAPEQARGDSCDARTDVFALGIMLWENLTYERLFFGEMDVAVLVQVMECVVPSPQERNPNVPEALAAVALKALKKDPNERYASARDFAQALERAASAADLFAPTSEVEHLLSTHFEGELAARDEAVRTHLSRSAGEIVPLKRGELALVSKLFDKKHRPKMREMHTRTGQVSPPTPPSGVRNKSGSIEIEVAPTAVATPAPGVPAPPAPRKSPPLGLVVAAVIAAIAVLSLGAYALSSALSPAEPEVAAPEPPPVPTPAPVEASEPVEPPVVVAAPPPEPPPEPVLPPTATPEVTPPVETAVPGPRTGRRREPTGTSSTGAGTGTTTERSGAVIEENPYVTH